MGHPVVTRRSWWHALQRALTATDEMAMAHATLYGRAQCPWPGPCFICHRIEEQDVLGD